MDQPVMADENFEQIKTIINTTNQCISAIKRLDVKTDDWFPFVIVILEDKFDSRTMRLWEEKQRASTELSNMNELMSF